MQTSNNMEYNYFNERNTSIQDAQISTAQSDKAYHDVS